MNPEPQTHSSVARVGNVLLAFFKKPIFKNYYFTLSVWIVATLGTGCLKMLTKGIHGNYKIYKSVFYNAIQHHTLYAPMPEVNGDMNHYGPFFSVVIAPFAMLPDVIGAPLWLLCLTVFLFYSIKSLPLNNYQHQIVYWLSLNSLIIALTNVEFSIAITATIVFSYAMVQKENDKWAAFMIMFGTFVKLYSIVGLAFFFFSKHKLKFVVWCLVWSVVFFVLPMAISSPDFILSQYKDWFYALVDKNSMNNGAVLQNISFIGMIKKTTGCFTLPDTPFILLGLLLFALAYFQVKKWNSVIFQMLTLAAVMNFVVLFNTASEANTYIIAIVGVAIWIAIQPTPLSWQNWALIIFAIAVSSFSPSDLFPRPLYKNFVRPYSLQALPCTLVWLKILYEMAFSKLGKHKAINV